jgi:hypothetical protein
MSARRRSGKASRQRKAPRRSPPKARSAKSADPPFTYLPRRKVIYIKSVVTYGATGGLAGIALVLTLIKDHTSSSLPDSYYAVGMLCGFVGVFKYLLTFMARLGAQAAYKEGFDSEAAPSLIFNPESALVYTAVLLLLTYELWTHWFYVWGIRSAIVAMAITIDLWFLAIVWAASIQVRRLPEPKTPPHRDIASRSRELVDKVVTWILTATSASLGVVVILATVGLLIEPPQASFPWWKFLFLLALYLFFASLIRAAAITRVGTGIQISTPLLWKVVKRFCLFGAATSGVCGFLGFLVGLAIAAVNEDRGSEEALITIGNAAVLGGAIGSVMGVLALPKAAVQRQRELPAVKWLTSIRISEIDLRASRWGSSDAKRQWRRRKNPAQ